MKIRLFAALLIALLSLSLLTGCDLNNQEAQAKLPAAEELSAQGVENVDAVPAQGEAEIPLPQEPTNAPQPTQPQPTTPQPTTPPAADKLTTEQAKEIALKHAGLTADQVKGLRAEFDYDDRVPEYEVEFYHDGTEYDYEIHAETGEIIRVKKEVETVSAPQPTQPQTTTPPAADKLTADQAKEIALKHAGLTAEQVTRLKAEFDYDDGVPEYQVEFRHNGWEYDYEIHAQTGKILDWDKEFDD